MYVYVLWRVKGGGMAGRGEARRERRGDKHMIGGWIHDCHVRRWDGCF